MPGCRGGGAGAHLGLFLGFIFELFYRNILFCAFLVQRNLNGIMELCALREFFLVRYFSWFVSGPCRIDAWASKSSPGFSPHTSVRIGQVTPGFAQPVLSKKIATEGRLCQGIEVTTGGNCRSRTLCDQNKDPRKYGNHAQNAAHRTDSMDE